MSAWRRTGVLAAVALVAAAPAPASDPVAQFTALRSVDARLAAIGFRLATANAALCADREPGTGAVLHAIDQYEPALRPAARAAFGFPAPVSVEAVVSGSPAERAGVAAGDGVLAVDGAAMPAATGGAATGTTRDAALALVAPRPTGAPLAFSVVRGGAGRQVTVAVTVASVPACRAAFEVLLGPRMIAQSNGRTVQVGVRYLAKFGDDRLVVIVAHELAHIVLRHRARLEAAGVTWGVFAELGRSGRLFRRTEDEADALGVVLMRNAGYDPRAAVAFWQHDGSGLDGSIFRSRTHASAEALAKAIAVAIAAIPADAPTPWVPPVIATRDEPLR